MVHLVFLGAWGSGSSACLLEPMVQTSAGLLHPQGIPQCRELSRGEPLGRRCLRLVVALVGTEA